MGSGIICRNSDGTVVALSAFQADSETLIMLLWKLETDCLELVKATSSTLTSDSRVCVINIIEDIEALKDTALDSVPLFGLLDLLTLLLIGYQLLP